MAQSVINAINLGHFERIHNTPDDRTGGVRTIRTMLYNFMETLEDKAEYESFTELLDQLRLVRRKIVLHEQPKVGDMKELHAKLLETNECLSKTKDQLEILKDRAQGLLNKH